MTKTIKKCIVCGSLNGYHKMSCYEHNRKDAMKFRNGFVSNSSSSSFVVISNSEREVGIPDNLIKFNTILELGNCAGETKFGWSPEEYYDIGSKLNLAWLLTDHSSDNLIDRLKTVINKKHPEIDFITFEEGISAYVDHQSVDDLMEIYQSDDSLYKFIFKSNSYIVTDNDNH